MSTHVLKERRVHSWFPRSLWSHDWPASSVLILTIEMSSWRNHYQLGWFTKTKEPVGEKLVFLLERLRGTVTRQSSKQSYCPQRDRSLYENKPSYRSKGISPRGHNLNFHFLNLPNTNKVVCHDLWMPGSQCRSGFHGRVYGHRRKVFMKGHLLFLCKFALAGLYSDCGSVIKWFSLL